MPKPKRVPSRAMKPGESIASTADRSRGGKGRSGFIKGPAKSRVYALMESIIASPAVDEKDPGETRCLKEWFAADKSGFMERFSRMMFDHDRKVEEWKERRREWVRRKKADAGGAGADPSTERVQGVIEKLLREMRHGER